VSNSFPVSPLETEKYLLEPVGEVGLGPPVVGVKPLEMVGRVLQEEEGAAGCGGGVGEMPWNHVEVDPSG